MYMVLFGKLTNVPNNNRKAGASLTAAGVDVDFKFTVVTTSAPATAVICRRCSKSACHHCKNQRESFQKINKQRKME